jgi:hypothetical protein
LDTDTGKQAAVDEVVATRAESSSIGSQERCEFSDLFRGTVSPQWMSRGKAFEYLSERQTLTEVRCGSFEHRRSN